MENTNEGAALSRRVAQQWLREDGELIPISHLSLDLAEPVAGWTEFFATRGVEVVEDDLGRPSVARRVLGELITERREREERLAAEHARKTADAPIVPALENGSAMESIRANDPGYRSVAEEFGRPSPRWIEQELEQSANRRRDEIAKEQAVKKAAREQDR